MPGGVLGRSSPTRPRYNRVFFLLSPSEPRPQLSFARTGPKLFKIGCNDMSKFTKSLQAFRTASPWLSAEHEPELTALEFLADSLDNDPPANPAPLISQWGLLLRSLRKSAPEAAPNDPLDALLTRGL